MISNARSSIVTIKIFSNTATATLQWAKKIVTQQYYNQQIKTHHNTQYQHITVQRRTVKHNTAKHRLPIRRAICTKSKQKVKRKCATSQKRTTQNTEQQPKHNTVTTQQPKQRNHGHGHEPGSGSELVPFRFTNTTCFNV